MLSLALSWTVLHGMPVSAENQTADRFKESTETILNPGMGYTSTIWYRCAPGNTPVQNPTGSLVLTILATVAEEESRSKSFIMNWSIERRFSKGIFLTPKLLGYDLDEEGQLVINPDEAETVKVIYYLFSTIFL